MALIRTARTEDIPQLYALWQTVFRDSDAFLDAYFGHFFDPADVLTASLQGRIVSMSSIYRHKALSAGGQGQGSCPCIFAVATDEAARGRGLAMELIRRQIETQRNDPAVPYLMIAPAEESLFTLYAERFGFRPYFQARILEVVPSAESAEAFSGANEVIRDGQTYAPESPLRIRPLAPAAYNRMREEFLNGTDHLVFTDRQIGLEEKICVLSGGGLYGIFSGKADPAVSLPGTAAVTAAAPDADFGECIGVLAAERTDAQMLRINELLVPDEMTGCVLSAVHAFFGAGRYEVRLHPASDMVLIRSSFTAFAGNCTDCGIRDTAMLLSAGEKPLPESAAYAGFLFD